MPYTYLASPYSHPNPAVRHARYLAAQVAVNHLFNSDVAVYSPIVHCHHLTLTHQKPSDAKFWNWYNKEMLQSAEDLVVLKIPGWLDSKGIEWEVETALFLFNKPVGYLEFTSHMEAQLSAEELRKLAT